VTEADGAESGDVSVGAIAEALGFFLANQVLQELMGTVFSHPKEKAARGGLGVVNFAQRERVRGSN
jgi:hypothetical protein